MGKTTQIINHRPFMAAAIEQAKKAAAAGEVPVGAVVVKDGQLIAAACNQQEQRQDATAHAELLAIRAASQVLNNWRLAGCSLYVTLEPCPMCAGAIVLARLQTLVFGCSDSRWGGAGSLFNIPEHPSLQGRVAVYGGIMQQECRQLLQAFFQKKR